MEQVELLSELKNKLRTVVIMKYSSNYVISFPGESVVELFYGNIDAFLA